MKRLLRRAEGFWAGTGQISQDALNYIRKNMKGEVYPEQGTDHKLNYTFITGVFSLPFGELTLRYGALVPAQVAEALVKYDEYFKPLILTQLTQVAPPEARNLILTDFECGVTWDGLSIYMNATASTVNYHMEDGDYPYYFNN